MNGVALHGAGFRNNNVFDPAFPGNRDDCLQPFRLLREKLSAEAVRLDTSDMLINADANLQINADDGRFDVPTYLLALEPPTICPEHEDPIALARYRRIFTWNDDLVDGDRFIKINFPNQILVPDVDGFEKRDIFSCMIAGNKTSAIADSRDIYHERIQVIRWYERNAPRDFELYGTGWHLPEMQRGISGKIMRRLPISFLGKLGWQPFPSYRGRIYRKQDALSRSRFSFCYENTCGLRGYVTEKIFDALFAGCIPIYLGAQNIADYVSPNCFIDRREFCNEADLYYRLKSMSELEYKSYQANMVEYLNSDAAKAFSSEAFSNTIFNTLLYDLHRST